MLTQCPGHALQCDYLMAPVVVALPGGRERGGRAVAGKVLEGRNMEDDTSRCTPEYGEDKRPECGD